jgi:hypothetical protein
MDVTVRCDVTIEVLIIGKNALDLSALEKIQKL